MTPIRIQKNVDSELLSLLPELLPFLGRDVVLTVSEVLVAPEPKEGPINGGFAQTSGAYPDFDEEAFWALRKASMI